MLNSVWSSTARLIAVFVFVLSLGAVAAAGDVVLVEEHWELHVASTDSNSTAPQVATALAPNGSVDAVHAVFEINHQSVPEWAPGGLHLQLWEGEVELESRNFPNGKVMSDGQEVVTWKQTMKLENGLLKFDVDDGQSTTWGHFGNQGYLRMSVNTSLDNLNGYDPDVSVANSGVTYAGNRVTKLVLTRVRIVGAGGHEYVDETDRVVHEN